MQIKWKIIISIIFILLLYSISGIYSEKPVGNVNVFLPRINYYSTNQDIIENIPVKWNTYWHIFMCNWGDDTHKSVINPQLKLESRLNLVKFSPDDPKIFSAQSEKGLYSWNFRGHDVAEYECLTCTAWEAQDTTIKKPRLTVSRTVSPEVLSETPTLQKVTVFLRLEEPLPEGVQHFYIAINGNANTLATEPPLIELRVVDQTPVEGWFSENVSFKAGWSAQHPSLLEVGKTYTFEATFESTKSNEIIGSPIFKPEVFISYEIKISKGTEISNSTTVVYSDAISATFYADNVVEWKKWILAPGYWIKLNPIILGIVGEKPPFHVKIDADIVINPEVLDLASEGIFTVYIKLPKDYDASDIDVDTLSCNGAPAVKGAVFGKDNAGYKAEFNIQDLVNVPVSHATKLTITGELVDGTQFEGDTTVKIIDTQLTELSEKSFEEAVAAFDSENYELAKKLFNEAENTYRSISNFTKVSECQNYIDRCNKYLEEEKLKDERAEGFFKEGVSHFEHEQYDLAKTKFEVALSLFTELGDEKKVKECEEWIVSCEKQKELEEGKGFCTGSFLVMFLLLGGVLKGLFIGFSMHR